MSEYDLKNGFYGFWDQTSRRREGDEKSSYTAEVQERWRQFLIRAHRWNVAHPELTLDTLVPQKLIDFQTATTGPWRSY
jgi:hypothetical protein